MPIRPVVRRWRRLPGQVGICAYCQAPIVQESAHLLCGVCDMPHHVECWEANGGCAVYGCGSRISALSRKERAREARDVLDVTLPPDNRYGNAQLLIRPSSLLCYEGEEVDIAAVLARDDGTEEDVTARAKWIVDAPRIACIGRDHISEMRPVLLTRRSGTASLWCFLTLPNGTRLCAEPVTVIVQSVYQFLGPLLFMLGGLLGFIGGAAIRTPEVCVITALLPGLALAAWATVARDPAQRARAEALLACAGGYVAGFAFGLLFSGVGGPDSSAGP